MIARTATGIGWIGEMPQHWRLKPLKHIAEFSNGMAFKPSDWTQDGTPIIRIENLNGGDDFNCYLGRVEPRYIVGRGDLLFGWSGNRGTSFGPFVWAKDGEFYLNQHIFKVHAKGCFSRWLYWCLKSVTHYVEEEAHGIIGMVHVTKGKLGAIKVPVPLWDEQEFVASFLDRETAKIDALIAKQTEFLALLDEHRRALVTDAITKGLDPSVSMKDTGIAWIGQIPSHWPIPTVGRFYEIQLGKMLDTARQTGKYQAPYLRVLDVQWGRINTSDLPMMDFSPSDRRRFALLPGDLLVNEGGSYVGRSAIWKGELPECFYQKALHRVRPYSTEDSTRFLYYVMYAAVKLGVFVAGGNQTTIDHLTAEAFRQYHFPRPPQAEQTAIADHLDKALARLYELEEKSMEGVALLQERRSALITAAVTGRIDVMQVSPISVAA